MSVVHSVFLFGISASSFIQCFAAVGKMTRMSSILL